MVSARVERWKAMWESGDAARILAMYEADATHASGLVARLCPEAGGSEVRGQAQLGDFVRRALARVRWLRFELVSVTEEGSRAAIEYRRYSDVDGAPADVLELVEWDRDLIRAVRVFHR